jgi:hypothetical protein
MRLDQDTVTRVDRQRKANDTYGEDGAQHEALTFSLPRNENVAQEHLFR